MDEDQALNVSGVSENTSSIQLIQAGGLIQGETITLSLEDAAQLIFQQQGLQGDGEGRLQPGTYQIITQPLTSGVDNQISIIHTGNTDAIQGYQLDGQSLYLQQPNEEDQSTSPQVIQLPGSTELSDQSNSILSAAKDGTTEQFTLQEPSQLNGVQDSTEQLTLQETSQQDDQQEIETQAHSLQINLHANQSEHVFQMINKPEAHSESNPNFQEEGDYFTNREEDGVGEETLDNSQRVVKSQQVGLYKPSSPGGANEPSTYGEQEASQDKLHEVCTEHLEVTGENSSDQPAESIETEDDETNTTIVKEVQAGKVINPTSKPKPVKQPDFTKPIKVTDHMEVVVGGKKCLLKMDPDTGQLCAYPLISSTPSGKRRGRPKKSVMVEGHSKGLPGADSDQANSAAEGLLELSNTGPDGVRRSARARKKASSLEDYEMLEVSSDDDAAADNAEDEVLPTGAIRKRRIAIHKLINSTAVTFPPVKKGRGRPRRYPRPDDAAPGMQIPAMIIPSGDGQSIMMAPIQGLSNLEAFQEQVRNLQLFQNPRVEKVDDGTQFLNTSEIVVKPLEGQEPVPLALYENTGQPDPTSNEIIITQDTPQEINNVTSQDFIVTSSGLATSFTARPGDTPLVTGLTTSFTARPGDTPLTETAIPEAEEEDKSTENTQPTIIQIPETLLPMFIQKKDPQKIGLRASNSQLEMFKCRKCDFQGYYEQQYQQHIVLHTEDIVKCKCCPFVAFEKADVLAHFRNIHPKCVCNVCDHMAEHAYIIKRHMMRHSQIGCKCEICGKVYKDQYVLKMHVKMVHLPAEVLFECTACSKKFTRKAHLKRHLRIHDPEKPFKCPHCPYRGCERSDISKHLLIHEEPKHICEVCGKAFRHVKNKELHMKRHSGQRDYKCGVCDFYGYTFTDIRKHIERKHTDSKAFICDKCGTAFKSEMQLKEHKNQRCDVFMIEQALAIATTDGGTSQATIQIPSHYSLEGHQIQIDGQNMVIDNSGQITIENVHLGEDGMSLTPEQLQVVVNQSQLHDGSQNEVELIPEMGDDHAQYTHGPEGVDLTEHDEVLEGSVDAVENEIDESIEGIEDSMVDDNEEVKPDVNERMLEMVNDFDS